MTTLFHRLVRFKDQKGSVKYGEVPASTDNLIGQTVPIYRGDHPWDLKPTNEEARIVEVLCPLPEVPIYYGIGLNYKHHIEEAGFPVPQHPVIFTKPPDARAGPFQDIVIDAECKDMDYEGELCFIIGKDCRNFKKETSDPAEFILGFTVGNDVSSRFWQMPPQSGGQHGYAKSFDMFGPFGPVIVSPNDPEIRKRLDDKGTPDLSLVTKVNGEERQKSRTNDMLFGVSDLLEHLSRGTTLRKGSVIMTGTPSGVAAFCKPPKWLKSGDVVEIEIEELGKIKNKMIIQ